MDRLGTERDISWLYDDTTLRNITRTALFHFFLITFSVKVGRCSPGGSCLLWVMSTETSVDIAADIAVDIAVDSRSIVGRQSVDTRSIVGR